MDTPQFIKYLAASPELSEVGKVGQAVNNTPPLPLDSCHVAPHQKFEFPPRRNHHRSRRHGQRDCMSTCHSTLEPEETRAWLEKEIGPLAEFA